jgi:hypothetical protein
VILISGAGWHRDGAAANGGITTKTIKDKIKRERHEKHRRRAGYFRQTAGSENETRGNR